MKTLLLAIFSLCFCLSVVVALSQDVPNQSLWKTQAVAGVRLTTIMGTVQEDGDKLRFVTDQRAWNVDNPEILEVTKDTTCTRRLTSIRTGIQFTSQK
jgi:hypothetical protein